MVYILLPLIGGGWVGVSCNDFLTIYPTDRIVAEDFWKTKTDVDQMVDGTYQSMLAYDIQERAIIWGAFRSDELVKYSAYSDNTLDNIEGVNLLPTMKYCNWSAFYKVINNCNIVLNHAPGGRPASRDWRAGMEERAFRGILRDRGIPLHGLAWSI